MSRKVTKRRVAPHIIGTALNAPKAAARPTTQSVGGVTVAEVPVAPTDITATWEQEYGYVRRDLARIALFGGTIIATMVVLRVVVGL